jgi:hypothetical protein
MVIRGALWRVRVARGLANRLCHKRFRWRILCLFGFWAQPRYAGSGFPLQFLSLPAVGLRDFRFNPLRGYHGSLSPSPYRRQGVKAAGGLCAKGSHREGGWRFVPASGLGSSRHCELRGRSGGAVWRPAWKSGLHGAKPSTRSNPVERPLCLDCFVG